MFIESYLIFYHFYCCAAIHVSHFYYVFAKCTVNHWFCLHMKDALLLPYTSVLHLVHQPAYALSKMHFVTSVNLLYVSALECHPQRIFLEQRNTSPTHWTLFG